MLRWLLVLCAFASTLAYAQAYPTRPVRMVVPYAAGGLPDTMARLVAQRLTESLGQPFIVDNRPGAGGIGACEVVAKATSDGHTLLIADTPQTAVNLALYAKLPYDTLRDFAPVSIIGTSTQFLSAHASLPASTLSDLIALARAKPGQLRFGSSGIGSLQHLGLEALKSGLRIDIVHVPYKGTAPALHDVVGGHVHFMFSDAPPARALIEGGKVRALGVTTAERVKALPDVPPLAEVGIPGYNTASWHSISTAAGVPAPIVDKLAGEIRAVMGDAEVQKLLSDDGAIPQLSPPPAEFKRFVDSEITRWGELVAKAGILHSQ
jgi:tripartite-type tricarboxylate transporter receptor subunit TctC